MKDLEEFLTESINEAQTFPLAGAYNTESLIEFAANFDCDAKFDKDWQEEEHWEAWTDDADVDWQWAMKHKPIVKKFCNLCAKISSSSITYTSSELGNYPGFVELARTIGYEGACSETGLDEGYYHLYYCTDGDDGRFFRMYTNKRSDMKLMDEFVKITHDPAGWSVYTEDIPGPDLETY